MKREVIITADGSPTLFVPEINEHYHSVHGAFQESMHVFINNGLLFQMASCSQLHILEVGLGTASNLMLTLHAIANKNIVITYDALEPFPLAVATVHQIGEIFAPKYFTNIETFNAIHLLPDNTGLHINQDFYFTRLASSLEEVIFQNKYDLVYFDAFGPRAQPEIWSQANFEKIYHAMHPNGILVTYCAKGDVRRTLQSIGFVVERLPGPPGKREMLRAIKK